MRARYKGVQTTKGTTRGRSGAGQHDGQQDDEASLVGLVHIAGVRKASNPASHQTHLVQY